MNFCNVGGCTRKIPDYVENCGAHSPDDIALAKADVPLDKIFLVARVNELLVEFFVVAEDPYLRDPIAGRIVALGESIIPTVCSFLETKHAEGMSQTQAWALISLVAKTKSSLSRDVLLRLLQALSWAEISGPECDRSARSVIVELAGMYGTDDMVPVLEELQGVLSAHKDRGNFDRYDIDEAIRAMKKRPGPPRASVEVASLGSVQQVSESADQNGNVGATGATYSGVAGECRRRSILPRLGSKAWLHARIRGSVLASVAQDHQPRESDEPGTSAEPTPVVHV